jgi:hypothetical protein
MNYKIKTLGSSFHADAGQRRSSCLRIAVAAVSVTTTNAPGV